MNSPWDFEIISNTMDLYWSYQDETFLPMEGCEMPDKIRKFHQVNKVDQFQYDRPYHKGNKDRDNEFKVKFF